jgi:hypothetical protein
MNNTPYSVFEIRYATVEENKWEICNCQIKKKYALLTLQDKPEPKSRNPRKFNGGRATASALSRKSNSF